MKKIVLFLLKLYKGILSPFLHQVLGIRHACRYYPSCSEFATIHIQKEGVLIGGFKSILRILCCQPFVEELPLTLRK